MPPSELQHLMDASPVHCRLRLTVMTADETGLTCRAEPGAGETGGDGGQFLHGGVVATLLDTAATFALINATGTDWSTVDLRTDFLRPAAVGALLVSGTVVQAGKRLGRASATLSDAVSGRLLATCSGTFVRTGAQP
jgi:uncharacterized protein (TIGR00369 family)